SAFLSPLPRAHDSQPVTLWARFLVSQHRDKFLLKCRRDGMLQALCLIVNFKPSHAEYLEEHALDQVMAKNGFFRDLPSFGSQLNAAFFQGDQTVPSQPLEGRGDRRRRYG